MSNPEGPIKSKYQLKQVAKAAGTWKPPVSRDTEDTSFAPATYDPKDHYFANRGKPKNSWKLQK